MRTWRAPDIGPVHAWIAWVLILAGFLAGWFAYGWPGLILAISVTVFWLLLQFSRVMRLLQRAGSVPVGQIASAVMFAARLRKGLKLMDVIALAGSLGASVSTQPEIWRWSDADGFSVELLLERGRCVSWTLTRPDAPDDAAQTSEAAAS